jgi:hypothetical protein
MTVSQLDEIRELKSRKPFRHFRIVTTSGEKYLVRHRFQFAVGQTRVMYAFPESDRTIEFPATDIAAVEVVDGVES